MRKTLILIFIVCVALFQNASAQNISNLGNLRTINADDLSDEQIQAFVKKAEGSGYSQQQLELLAKARGMSSSEISKLRNRISQLKSFSGGGNLADSISRFRQSPDFLKESRTSFDPFDDMYPEDSSFVKDNLPIFGLSFFRNSNLTFEPSLSIPTPENYMVGPGDQIIIDIWGASENTYQLTISPEGSVLIPNLGPIYLNGLNVEKVESKLKYKLKSIYSSLGENTFAQISLGQIKTISVNVVGEVVRPGTYQMSSFATAFNVLYQAGGPSKIGSLRKIIVFRNGEKVGALDAYKLLIEGEGQNITLQDQDVVLVQPYGTRVALSGEVKRPAYYEVLPNESLEKLLMFSGGFTSKAYSKSASLQRNDRNFKIVKTVGFEEFESFKLADGDKIEVGIISTQFRNRVRVEGAVNHPGEYEVREDTKLSEIITQSDGFRDDAFMQRALIIRENDDLSLSSLAFKPSEVISGDFDIKIKGGDLIKVQSIFDLSEFVTLTLEGEVQEPGTFPYVDKMTVENLIFLGGGFKESAAKSFVEVARRIKGDGLKDDTFSSEIFNFPINESLGLSDEASTFELQPFDLVVIRESPFYKTQSMVEVEGELLYPGKYAIEKKNERISDLINRAGGFTSEAFPKGGTLIRKTEYFDDAEAAKVKMLRIMALGNNDTTTTAGSFAINKTESIAIELEKILENPGSDLDLILKEGDLISVPRQLQTVRIRGEVYFSSNVIYDGQTHFKDYIGSAGGGTTKANMKKSYIVYPNGSAKKTKSFLWFKDFPDVEPGSEIIVPAKRTRRRMSPQEIIGITTGLATLGLLTNQIINTTK
ncbi:MAG: SLBB domain-containing protein [Cyclobacteriaceae bacterium]